MLGLGLRLGPGSIVACNMPPLSAAAFSRVWRSCSARLSACLAVSSTLALSWVRVRVTVTVTVRVRVKVWVKVKVRFRVKVRFMVKVR